MCGRTYVLLNHIDRAGKKELLLDNMETTGHNVTM